MPTGSHITINDRLRACTALVSAAALFVTQSTAYALPQGGQVNGGQASIASSGNQLTVNQSSQRAIIDWNSFNIGAGEGVRFNQPSSSSIALNHIHDANPSQIYGSLTANGNVWLINPNGILFGRGAQVNLGGLLATTSDIDNDRFMNGDYTFNHPGNPNATISNAGNITIADGGLAALVGPNVNNSGLIEAKLGKVQLGSGDSFTLDLYGDGLINLQASPAITQQLVDNSGVITADGGSVLLTAAAAGNVINSLINMDGYIQANSVGSQTGTITLYGEGSNAVAGNVTTNKEQKQGTSTVLVSGTLDASGYGPGQTGGSISVLGDNVGIMSGAFLDASGDAGGGTIKIGGDFHGQGTTPTALNTYVDPNSLILANAITQGNGGNVTIWSDGNTYFYGNILAEGRAQSGNGGFVETSGHGYLDEQGYVNLTAPSGNKGTWLLDPTDITIEGETASVFNSPNLVDAYTLNDGSGTTAADSSGNGNNGTLNGGVTWSSNVAPAPGGNTYSASLNGTTGYISAGAAGVNPSTSDLTVSVWVNLASYTAVGGVNSRIVFSNIDGNNAYQLVASDQVGNATFSFSVNQGGGQYAQAINATTATNTWYNIVGTFNKTTDAISLYVNGVAAASSSDPGFGLGAADNKLYLGARSDGFGFTNGLLQDVGIYNAALSATNIAELAGTLFTVAGIEKMSQTADVSIQASHNITMDFQGDTLAMTAGRNLTLNAGNDIITASAGTINTSQSSGAGGNISLTGTSGIILSNAYTLNSGGGSITLNGPTTLNAALAVNSNNGAVSFGSTVDGANNLTVNSGTGGTTFTGAIGSGTPLSSLSLTGDALTFDGDVFGTGTLTIQPYTASTALHINDGTSSGLYLTSAEQGYIQNDWAGVTIGNTADTGAMTIGASTWVDPMSFNNGSNKIEFSGAQTLGANSLTAVTASGNIVMDQNAKIASTAASGNSIVLAAGGNFINNDSNDGSSALSPGSGTARYLVYSANPSLNTLSGLSDAGIHIFNKTYSGYAPGSVTQTGNLFLYSLAPIITVTADGGKSMTYGAGSLPSLTYTLSGLVDSDTSSILTGAPTISTTATAYNGTAHTGSNVGTYDIDAALNNLANTIGYGLATANAVGGLTVNTATLTVTANNQARTYGAANPTFTEAVTGYANGDTSSVLTGSIPNGSSAAIATSGIGAYTITGSTAGLGAGSNYTIAAPVNGTLTINPATLTVTADGGKSMTYGAGSLPSLTDTITGYQNSEGAGVITGGSATLTTTATAYNGTAHSGSNAGTYDIDASGNYTAANYTFTYANAVGGLTVNPATLTVTANNQARTYGAANPTFTEAVTGYANGDTSSVLTGSVPNGSSTAIATTGIGAYTITGSTAGLGAGSNYTIAAPVNGTLTINPATLTVTADGGKSMTYGAGSLPSLTDTITGYQNSEGAGVITGGSATLSTTATAYNGTAHSGSNVGTYDIDASGNYTAANYTFTYANAVGGLTVNPATLTVTANNQARTYGAANPTFTEAVTGYANGDTSSVLTGSVPNGSTTAIATTGIGAYTITGSTAGLGAGSNYTIAAPVNGTLTINPATLTVTADGGKSMTYGAGSLPSLTDTITGYQNSEGAGVITGGSATLSTTATAYNGTAHSGSNVGTYDIDASGNYTAANYTFAYANAVGGLTVNAATLTVTANNQARTYGAANPTFTEAVTGYANGDTSSVLTGSIPNGSSAAIATTGIGAYTITGSTAGLGAGGNYTIAAPVNGTLTINPATLTVTANNQSMVYGAGSLPSLTDTITGYQNGEGSGVLSGSASLSTTATAYNGTAGSGSNVGGYTITAGNGTLAASNYTFGVPVNGTLTVNAATLTVTANNQARTYGAANPTFTEAVTGYANGDTSSVLTGSATGSSTATNTSGVGGYTITGSNGTLGVNDGNYTFAAPVNGTLTINPATLTVTANDATRAQGLANPAFTASYSSFQNSDNASVLSGLVISSPANMSSPSGAYSIIPSGATAANYTIGFVNGLLTVTASGGGGNTPVTVPDSVYAITGQEGNHAPGQIPIDNDGILVIEGDQQDCKAASGGSSANAAKSKGHCSSENGG